MASTSVSIYVETAVSVAREAGAILRDRFGKPHDIRYKGPLDMVTEADKAAEDLIAARLSAAFPGHDLLGEEGSRGAAPGSPFRWVIDPLDGTTNFAHNMPIFAVSIALEEEGTPIVGVIYDPMRDELFVAGRGEGATLNGKPIHPSSIDQLTGSLLVTGFSYTKEKRERQGEVWCAMLTKAQAIRQTGSAALNLCYVAAGRLDGYWEQGIFPWDVSAGALIVAEAGGLVTDMAGGPFRSADRQVLASNGFVHQQMLQVLQQFPTD